MRIESFSFGTITIEGQKYSRDVLLLPPRVIAGWWRKEGHRLDTADLAEAIAYHPDTLVVGTGASGMMRVPESTVRDIESTGAKVEVFPTDKACERFNGLMEIGEKVAAAFHLTC
jgi:hypothetical protein